ncbi:hypothetical protein [Curtobacterium flaccumfaciens]|uniref:hypothetical protein n=1 Tax=Curtobacterium flaccumfaciens TaxID=2035 RepID=UPI002207F18A|nr:hypothetical protein [Curtobacterium flaccumfaciens]UWD79251.1 hypothetical protein NY058_00295 [Curtobacterium flaccumfaciens]
MTNGRDRQVAAAADGGRNESAGAGGQGTRQPPASHHLARIPFTTVQTEVPADLRALYVNVDEGQAVIPGLQMGVGALVVQQWNPTYAAAGWTLYGADLTLDMGHPFGALFYRNDADDRVLRIGVQWHPPVQRLEFPALHPSRPELSGDCTEAEVDAVILDARSRIGALVAINAQIGSWVAAEESEDAILAAAGLGLERLSEDDARLAHDA